MNINDVGETKSAIKMASVVFLDHSSLVFLKYCQPLSVTDASFHRFSLNLK